LKCDACFRLFGSHEHLSLVIHSINQEETCVQRNHVYLSVCCFCNTVHKSNVPSDFAENGWDFEEPESDNNEADDDASDSDCSESEGEEATASVLSSEEMRHHLSRLDKVHTQVIVVVAQRKKSGVFTCKSSTRNGQKYLVRIKNTPCCTCLDYAQVTMYT